MALFSSAVNGLRNHHDAVKPATWRGYVYRFDAREYSTSKAYSAGDEVMFNGTHYVCGTDGQPAGEFDSSKWARATIGARYTYYIIFVEDSDFEKGSSTGIGKDTYAAYRICVTVYADGGKTYADPVCMSTRTGGAQAGDYDQFYDATPAASNFPVDSGLFSGFMAGDWETGTKEDFDKLARGGNRW